jgi:hypothetical protein
LTRKTPEPNRRQPNVPGWTIQHHRSPGAVELMLTITDAGRLVTGGVQNRTVSPFRILGGGSCEGVQPLAYRALERL